MSSSESIQRSNSHSRGLAASRPKALTNFALEISGSIFVLVLVNFFALWYLEEYSTNFGYWTLHQKWSLLEKMEEPVDWLILGDSSCNQGVSPAIITKLLGKSAVNLCTIGNVTALNDLWMLQEYIDRFGPPGGVVIVHVYDIWSRDLNPVILGQIPRPWGFWKERSMGSELLHPQQVRLELFQERYIPLLSQRSTLQTILRSVFSGKLVPFREKWHMERDGFLMEVNAQPEIAIQDGKDHMQFVRENQPALSLINQASLRELKGIAETYQVPIYLVNSPLIETLNSDEGFQAYQAGLHAQMESIIGQSEWVHLISEVKTFPANQLQTADHLIYPGAQVFTSWLIQAVLSR